MKPVFAALSLACFFLLAGCVSHPTPEMLAEADYGPPPPKKYKEIIKRHFYVTFVDSIAPVYSFKTPVKAYTKRSRVINTREMYGWAVCGTVNSRHKISGYLGHSGPRPFFVLFRDGKIVQKYIGQLTEDEYAPNRFNEAIAEVCAGIVPEEDN